MSLRTLARAWNDFFFQPQLPTPVALFRVLYGLIFLADLLLMRADWLTFFGARGLVSLQTERVLAAGPRLDIFAWIPQTDPWVLAVFWVALIAGICLTIGFQSRLSSIAVFVLVTSMHQRNLFIIHGGDTLLRVTGFFLMFAPAGAAFSVDRLLRIWNGKEGLEITPRAPWAQRMIQFETAMLYFMTFVEKSLGPAWVDGTALHYVFHLDQFKRFPVPAFFEDPFMVKLETWGTLAIEFSMGVLVWIKELRYPLLLAGLLLHLSLEYSMNVPLFQWIILATYVTFVEPADLTRAWAWVRGRVTPYLAEPIIVSYDPQWLPTVNVIRALDVFQRIRFVKGAGHVSIRRLIPLLVPFPAPAASRRSVPINGRSVTAK